MERSLTVKAFAGSKYVVFCGRCVTIALNDLHMEFMVLATQLHGSYVTYSDLLGSNSSRYHIKQGACNASLWDLKSGGAFISGPLFLPRALCHCQISLQLQICAHQGLLILLCKGAVSAFDKAEGGKYTSLAGRPRCCAGSVPQAR